MAKKQWKVPFYYEQYGYILVTADTPEGASIIAGEELEKMKLETMQSLTEYLPESERIDPEGEPLLIQ